MTLTARVFCGQSGHTLHLCYELLTDLTDGGQPEYGLRIEYRCGHRREWWECRRITRRRERAQALQTLLWRQRVLPVHLQDVLQDVL